MEDAIQQESAIRRAGIERRAVENLTWAILFLGVATVLLSMWNVWSIFGLITGPVTKN